MSLSLYVIHIIYNCELCKLSIIIFQTVGRGEATVTNGSKEALVCVPDVVPSPRHEFLISCVRGHSAPSLCGLGPRTQTRGGEVMKNDTRVQRKAGIRWTGHSDGEAQHRGSAAFYYIQLNREAGLPSLCRSTLCRGAVFRP